MRRDATGSNRDKKKLRHAGTISATFEEIMQLPSVDNFVKDLRRGVTYNVCAYRTLSWEERMGAVQVFMQQQGMNQPRQGTIIKIFSLIGLNDG